MHASTALTFLLAMVLVIGGWVLMAYAFSTPGLEFVLFTAGLVAEFVGFAVPAILWRAQDRKHG